ncbi:MAG: hypothetical protein IPK97_10365 [Ahniella sp.]|nr:hypothetical protein [Ahniella sp.]
MPRAGLAARRLVSITVTLICSAQAVVLLWVAGCFLVHVGLRHPMFDQFRLYPLYLSLPFPDNIFQIENGHRPVLPALVRVFEIWATAADQTVQLWVGALAALAVALAGAVVHRRFDRAGAASTALAALAGCMGVFWMANARMLLHGNESVHAYFAAGFALLAFLVAWRSSRRRCPKCFAMAIAFAIAAGLSFGPGLAAFGLVLIAALLAGNWRFLTTGIGVSLVFAIIYLVILPQGDHAQTVIRFDPTAFVDHLLVWLGSALAYAGLGANPTLGLMHAPALAESPLAIWSADPVVWWVLRTTVIGVIALTLFSSWRSLRDPDSTPKIVLVGIGLSWFAIGAGFLVCLARSDYFTNDPGQRFADRYLLWSCLFFLGAWFQVQGRLRQSPLPLAASTALLFGVIAMMKPADRSTQIWAVIVHQINERIAAAMLLDLDAPEFIATDPAAPEQSRRETAALFRAHQLGVFAGPEAGRIERFQERPVTDLLPLKTLSILASFADSERGQTEVIFGQFDLGEDLPWTALLTNSSQGVCGIVRRVLAPRKAREIRSIRGQIHPGLTGFSACHGDDEVILWSLASDTPEPMYRINLVRP